jgi:hypothetical protein
MAPITAQEFRGLWADLETNGRRGDTAMLERSMRRLVSAPASAVPLLKQYLPPERASGRLLRQLIRDLDSARYKVRQKAYQELEHLGKAAKPALEAALAGNPSVEVRKRLTALLKKLADRPPARRELLPEERQLIRAVIVLGRIDKATDTGKAREVLRALAQDPRVQNALAVGWQWDRHIEEARATLAKASR